MKFRRNTGILVLSLLTAFFLSACGGGGGGDSSAPPSPTVVTSAATSLTATSTTLNGTVNSNGLATEAWFEWGTNSALTTFDNTAKQAFVAGTTVQQVSASVSGLNFSTPYYFRLVASNSSGVTKGDILNFSTSALAPTVTTLAADNVTSTSATLHGQVNPNLLATDAWFEYGTDNTFGVFTKTENVPIGSGSAVVPVNKDISSLAPGGTYYFRVAASNATGEQKGTGRSLSTLNPPPVANAGPDNTVEMGQTVTLNGSGSTTPFGTITSYLWTQVAGTAATLSDNTAANPTFTPPTVPVIGAVLRFQLTVTDSRSLTASDNVDITVKWVGFADDFSSDTTGTYTVATTLGTGGTFTWDSSGKKAQLDMGDNNGLKFSKAVLASNNGVFSLDFSPTTAYPSHGGIWVRLVQDANNYYEISNFDWGAGTPVAPDIAAVKKFVGGVMVDNVAFPTAYTQGNTYNLKITFSPTQVKLEGFGAPVILNTANTTAISVTGFEVEAGQQDAFYDNIKLIAAP